MNTQLRHGEGRARGHHLASEHEKIRPLAQEVAPLPAHRPVHGQRGPVQRVSGMDRLSAPAVCKSSVPSSQSTQVHSDGSSVHRRTSFQARLCAQRGCRPPDTLNAESFLVRFPLPQARAGSMSPLWVRPKGPAAAAFGRRQPAPHSAGPPPAGPMRRQMVGTGSNRLKDDRVVTHPNGAPSRSQSLLPQSESQQTPAFGPRNGVHSHFLFTFIFTFSSGSSPSRVFDSCAPVSGVEARHP